LSDGTAEVTAVVLAGRRGASDVLADALASASVHRHHALVDVHGVPMLARVVRSLCATQRVGPIVVSIDDPAVLDGVSELAPFRQAGRVTARTAADSPSRSVSEAIAAAPEAPVLVVTADHALLTPQMVDHFLEQATSDADVWVGVVTAAVIRAHYPETRRTYLKFRDEWVSGANLFLFCTPKAAGAAEFWIRAERYRKQPWRLVAVLGPWALLAFLLRRLDLDAALERVSHAIGARVRAVRMPFAEAAIDVDRPADLELANRILAEREGNGGAK
jgi:GTP:adenosylcobinamide-phosphate guanylyltransferase